MIAKHKDIETSSPTQRAQSLLSANQNDEARAEFEAAVRADPNDKEAIWGLSECDCREGKYDKALETCLGLFKESRDIPLVLYNISLCYIRLNRLDDLRDFWIKYLGDDEIAKEISKNNKHLRTYDALNICSKKFALNDDYDSAIKLGKIAIEYDKDNLEAYVDIGMLYYAKNDYKNTISAIKKAYDGGYKLPPTVLDCFSGSYYETEDYKNAIEIDIELLEKIGDDYKILCNISSCYQQLGQIYKATPFIERAIKADPGNITVFALHEALGETYYTLGYYKKASDAFNMAMGKLPKKAIDKSLLEGVPDKDTILAYAAEVSKCMGRQREATKRLRKAIKTHSDDYASYLSLADSLMKQGERDEAIEVLKEFSKTGINNNFITSVLYDIENNTYNGVE